jgi:pimeloyl-[acyl-carrier protein] methyl ester esterase
VTLLLLPGLDGTEVFFQPLLACLPASVRPLVVPYPNTTDGCRYADLLPIAQDAIAAIPECYVLGWSFAGPLALMLAAAEPGKVRGVILSATFVRAPSEWLRRLRFFVFGPTLWLYRAARRVPLWLFRPANDAWRVAKSATWQRVSAAVIAARIRAVLSVDVRDLLRSCRQPVMYLASSEDDVIPSHNLDEVIRVRPSVEVATIAGRHLAMYTNAQMAARAVVAFMEDTERARRSAAN